MILTKRTILQALLWVFILAALAGILAEPLLRGNTYLSDAAALLSDAALLFLAAYFVVLSLRYARALRRPVPEYVPDKMLPAESIVSNQSYQLRICRTDPEQLGIVMEARFSLRAGLMALCPAGWLLVGAPAVIWATVAEPPTHWAWYPLIAALLAFLVWLGIAHVAMYIQQSYWGTTRLTFTGERMSQRVTWCGRVWIDRSYRIGPAASVRSDLSPWFGVMIRGLESEQPRTCWKWLLLMCRADRISFGAALAPADAQIVAAFIQQHLQASANHLRAETLPIAAGI